MTDDELDLLASAYVDGEATPEEVALVERDPELLARVEFFRTLEVDEPAAPPAGLAGTQLAAAMVEFERLTDGAGEGEGAEGDGAGEAEPTTAPVVDLQERAAARSPRPASSGRDRARSARTMPSWLPAAAAFIVIGGGAIWAFGQAGGSDDDAAESATEALDTTEESSDEASDAGDDGGEATSAGAAQSDLAAESAALPEAEEAADDDAMEQEEAMEEEEAMEDESAEDRADDEGDAEADFVELTPLLFFAEPPTDEELGATVLPEPETDLDRSSCGPEIQAPSLGQLVGFVPVEVLGQPAELFVFESAADGTEVRLLVDENCLPFDR